jgi:hypothetical protein
MLKISRITRKNLMVAIWAVVAGMLAYRGCTFLPDVEGTGDLVMWISIGLAIGAAKGWFVLSKSAARTCAYIDRRPELDWFWLSLHPVLYILIPAMIGLGEFMRETYGKSIPGLVAALYLGVAVALLLGLRGVRGKLR